MKVDEFFKKEAVAETTFVLPLATIIETGNHTKSGYESVAPPE